MDIELREWRAEDAKDLCKVVNDTDRKYLRMVVQGEYTEAMASEYIARAVDSPRGVYRAIVIDGELAGCISVEKGRDIADIDGNIGCYMARKFTRHGVATQIVPTMAKLAFERLGLERITAYLATDNIGSTRVLEKCGFVCEGIMRRAAKMNGEIIDVAIYATYKDIKS